ncbi:tRNA lysidine(34) synthetase TilS [Pacificoceanicola onchidii]|uniref:tRNA lysidine(34) synthetase TilS n=1 Tax=Pacificoceanicola onchidii TaxID=2562685 RepID=UPI001F10ECA1|nr:tRNA lysidine(34) synthetase TilS [Pacificoceanicola onchidii]
MADAPLSLDQRFTDAMGQLIGPDFPSDIGLAVSGGGDSMAMLALAHNWAHRWGTRLWVMTVDHGLRAESADEAAMVAAECATLGHPHATLRWTWDGQGNLMDEARRARLELMSFWKGRLSHVLVAHTLDDVAETFLMRLKRGSGVDGLSAMSTQRALQDRPGDAMPDHDGTLPPRLSEEEAKGRRPSFLYRPCLAMRREELRHYIRTLQVPWADDPSNDDPGYERVRMRRLLSVLESEGLPASALAHTASRLSEARRALNESTAKAWQVVGQEPMGTGDLLFDRDGFGLLPVEVQRRLIASGLRYVASTEYAPRAEKVETLWTRVLSGGGGTLNGCEIRHEGPRFRMFREYKAVESETPTDGLWDARWSFQLGRASHIAALGDAGWRQVAEKPEGAPPYHAARSLPALWQGDRLIACPALGLGQANCIVLRPMRRSVPDFHRFLLSH